MKVGLFAAAEQDMNKYLPILVSLFLLFIVIVVVYYEQQEQVTCEQEAEPETIATIITLDAPSECEIGELVTLDATLSEANSFSWTVIPATPNFAIIEEGKRAFFSSPSPGSYLFIVAAAKDNTVDCIVHELIVRGQNPVLDDFTILIKSWLPERTDPLLLAALSRSFKESADAKDIDALIKVTAVANRAVLGSNLNTYKSFLIAFSQYLKTNYQDKSLEEHQQLWLKIAETLKTC